ncbi:hypothetical protein DM860_010247 [Cuscuta australis]|uniref:Nodulin-like domain-containing protein n=1 Tax=Cuscuta australis TaxID=267555 RepID=A0A328DC46_9ASTE|nr:hypothetical protein DM860_010247 [Cuscuta australis]
MLSMVLNHVHLLCLKMAILRIAFIPKVQFQVCPMVGMSFMGCPTSTLEGLALPYMESSSQSHTGVMGLFYILVAEPLHNSNYALHETSERAGPWNSILGLVALCGVAGLIAAIAVMIKTSSKREDGYEPMVA